MLAYTFFHWPRKDASEYERHLGEFLQSMEADKPLGYLGGLSLRHGEASWLPGPAYLDWYRVSGFADLGMLNEGAVSGSRRAPHDDVARMAAGGAGGLYELQQGPADFRDAKVAHWFGKPPGMWRWGCRRRGSTCLASGRGADPRSGLPRPAQLCDQVDLAGDVEHVRLPQLQLREGGLVFEVGQVGPQQRDDGRERPGHQDSLRGSEEEPAAPLHRLGESTSHALVQEAPDQLRHDLRHQEQRDGHCCRRHRGRQAQVLAERLAETPGEESREHDAADEADQPEELTEQPAEGAPDREKEDEDEAEQVEPVHRMLMSFLISLPASSRLALKFGLFGS